MLKTSQWTKYALLKSWIWSVPEALSRFPVKKNLKP